MAASITSQALLALAANPPTDPVARKALHDAARHLVHATESASDTETRVLTSFTLLPLLRIATDLDLFNIIAQPNGFAQTWHIDDLARKTGADAQLLHRVLRFLATQGFISEVDDATYAPSPLAPNVQPSGFSAGVKHNSSLVAPGLAAFPGWLRKNGYRSPTSSKDCAFQDAFGPDIDLLGYLAQNPEQSAAVFEYMAWQKVRNKSWMNKGVKVAEEFKLTTEAEVENGRALFVDVGGGGGHQCFEFREAFPDRKGRLVVQDTDVMVGMIDKGEAGKIDLEPMAHDFFTPQPVKGAKVYYLRTVLHDWPDEKSVEILRQLRDAMDEDSLLVIDEIVVPGRAASVKQVLYDMVMLSCLGSGERSESQWREVLEKAGLRLREVEIYDEELCSALTIAVKA